MMTDSEIYDAALKCQTKDEAKALIDGTVDQLIQADRTRLKEPTRAVLLSNIGYYTGYGSRAEAARMLALFETRHPVFGAIEDWPKTPEETMLLGMKWAQSGRTTW